MFKTCVHCPQVAKEKQDYSVHSFVTSYFKINYPCFKLWLILAFKLSFQFVIRQHDYFHTNLVKKKSFFCIVVFLLDCIFMSSFWLYLNLSTGEIIRKPETCNADVNFCEHTRLKYSCGSNLVRAPFNRFLLHWLRFSKWVTSLTCLRHCAF